VGGFVVRDPGLPSLAGRYLYGDNCASGLESVRLGTPGGPVATGLSVTALTTFGEDACGPDLRRLVRRRGQPAAGRSTVTVRRAAGHAGARARRRIPRAATAQQSAARPASRRGLHGDGPRAALAHTPRRVALSAGVRRSVPLVATRDGARRLRRALARKRTLKLTVRIAARDASGNVKRRRARPGARR